MCLYLVQPAGVAYTILPNVALMPICSCETFQWQRPALEINIMKLLLKWLVLYIHGRYSCVFLTHWGRVMHTCVSKLTVIGWDNDLSPCRRQATIWTSFGISLIGPLGTNFNKIFIEIDIFSSKKTHMKVSSAKSEPFCLDLNILTNIMFMFGWNFAEILFHRVQLKMDQPWRRQF